MKNRNTSVLYLVIFISQVVMFGAITQNWLNSETTYETEVYAQEAHNNVPEDSEEEDTSFVVGGEAEPLEEGEVSDTSTVEEMIVDTFGEDAEMALAIAMCESHLRPRAFNNNETWGGVSQDHGIFQINAYYHSDKYETVDQLYDPEFNIKTAKQIYDGSDWYAWSCFKNGAYKKFLK